MFPLLRQSKLILSCLLFVSGMLQHYDATAQVKQMVLVKTFDQQLKPYKNLELVLNDKFNVTMDAKGAAFIELNESELPIRTVDIKTEGLETASWNFSKGAVEIIVRKKNYKLVTVTITDSQRQPIARADVVFTGIRKIALRTNAEGNIYIPLNLDERISAADQFVIMGYQPARLTVENGTYLLSAERQHTAADEMKQTRSAAMPSKTPVKNPIKSYDREIANLDTAQSLASFYQLVRNIAMDDLSTTQKNKVDSRFNVLLKKMHASVIMQPPIAPVMTKESATIPDDIRQLREKVEKERRQLDMQRTDDKLAQSKEAQLREQEEILIAGTSIVMVAALLILLVSSRRKVRRQKEELDVANNQITQLYEDFEGRVTERTISLKDANVELEMLLQGASQSLQPSIASIYGLGNIPDKVITKEFVGKVQGSAVVMDNLVKNLVVISELNQPKHLSEINVCKMMQKVKMKFEPQLEEGNIRHTWSCDESIRFKAYPVFFEAMITKLVENALFFSQLREMPEDQQPAIKVSIASVNKEIVIVVEDSGTGINEKIRPHIFEMFFKGDHSKGSGLGLFIVNRTVWHMQGNIKVDTRVDQYTRFTIRLPDRG